MISNYYTLAALANRLDSSLSSRRIVEVFTQERSRLAIGVEESPFLIISCDARMNAVFLDRRFTRARKNTLDLFTTCRGKRIEHVFISPDDRILNFLLDGGDSLQVRFFGARANVFHLGRDGAVLETFRKEGDPSEATEPPPHRSPEHLLTVTSDETVATVLKSSFPFLGTVLVREALYRASIPPSSPWSRIGGTEIKGIIRSLEEIQRDLRDVRPAIYDGAQGRTFALIPLKQFADRQEEFFDDINEAIRLVVAGPKAAKKEVSPRIQLGKQIETMLAKFERTAQAISDDTDALSRARDYERFGKLLLTTLATLQSGANAVDLTDDHGPARIALDPALSPAANAQRYFDKAKRSRTAQKENERRFAEIRERISLLRSLRNDLLLESDRTFLSFRTSHAEALETLGLTVKQQAASQLPFRSFRVDGGFEVWAGKNSMSNDQLTMKHAKPNDLWFHARGAGGSHVVLRVASAKGEPTKQSRMQAAAIAAYYSRMKGAGMVPVAVTLRKYVRKPKGAPDGTVFIEREEVLLVRPGLPENNHQTHQRTKES